MKKIVALVLSLVMVLGLATVASAASLSTNFGGTLTDDAALVWDAKLVPADAENAKDAEFATYTIEMTAKKTGVTAWWDSSITSEKGETEDFEVGGEDEFVKVATKDQANFVLTEGKTVTYLAWAKDYNTDGWDEAAEMVVLPYAVDDKKVCATDYAKDQAAPIFYEFEDTLYVAAKLTDSNVVVFNVDGVAVAAVKAVKGTDYVNLGHTYVVETATNNYGEFEVTKVFCKYCEKTFKFVVGPEELAVATFGAYGYDDAKDLQNGAHVWVDLVGTVAGATAPEAGDKVESAETFDAGIAMYVGMSVMAAAGSAVVLKKKD